MPSLQSEQSVKMSNVTIGYRDDDATLIKCLSRMHDTLGDVMEIINKCYSFTVIFQLITIQIYKNY